MDKDRCPRPVLDHLVWAAADLENGCDLIARLTGIRPVAAGEDARAGLRSAVMDLDHGVRLEVVSPLAGGSGRTLRGLAARIAAMSVPGLLTYALRVPDLNAVAAAAHRLGLDAAAPVAEPGAGGGDSARRMLRLTGHGLGGLVPMFVTAAGSVAAPRGPAGCEMDTFGALTPLADALRQLYDELHIGVPVRAAVAPGFFARLQTPGGPVALTHPH